MSICSIASAQLDAGLRDRGFERVEIHHHEIDRLNPVLSRGGFVLLVAAQVKQRAMHSSGAAFSAGRRAFPGIR